MGSWDEGVDYEHTYSSLVRLVRQFRSDVESGKKKGARRRLAKAITLLVQLKNGSRVSEAIEAVRKFATERERKVSVKVGKSEGSERLMVLPPEVKFTDLEACDDELGEIDRVALWDFAKRWLGCNTHSLRYAKITYLARNGISPQVIAAITGHKTLGMLIRYTQKVEAERVLETLK